MRYVFFDLETGGLDRERHAIIQIAALACEEDFETVLEEFNCRILFPPSAATEEALELNSYDPQVWAESAVHPDEAERRFTAFLERYRDVELVSKAGRPYRVAKLVGHNAASFDFEFLAAWYRRRGAFLPAEFSVLDTLQLARWCGAFGLTPEVLSGCKLVDLVPALGIEWTGLGEHDALADVRATMDVARTLKLRVCG